MHQSHQVEMGRPKSHAYWPKEIDAPMTFGALTVTSHDIVKEKGFIETLISITDATSGKV